MKQSEVIITVTLCALTATVYLVCDPMYSLWMPACPFHLLTGWQCPLCGGQRMMHALLHGHLAEAWHHNAVALLCLPWCAVIVCSYLLRHRHPSLYDRLLSVRAVVSYLVIAAAWGIVRNIMP